MGKIGSITKHNSQGNNMNDSHSDTDIDGSKGDSVNENGRSKSYQ